MKLPCAVFCLMLVFPCRFEAIVVFSSPQKIRNVLMNFFHKLLIRGNGNRLRTADVQRRPGNTSAVRRLE